MVFPQLTGLSSLIQTSECVCSGYRVTFECSVMGSGITVWQGSAFNCSNSGGGISLRHSQYAHRAVYKECRNRNVSAHAIGIVENNIYVSELSLNVSMDMYNKTIECVHDNGTISKLIGTATVNITSGTAIRIAITLYDIVIIHRSIPTTV